MTTLREVVLSPERRERVVASTAAWVEQYVVHRTGLRGLTLRTGLAALKAARPDALERGVARLLPEFLSALEPLYVRFRATGQRDFSEYLGRHADEATEALMAVTDARVAATSHRTLASGYRRMRSTLEAELGALVPQVARMLSQYV